MRSSLLCLAAALLAAAGLLGCRRNLPAAPYREESARNAAAGSAYAVPWGGRPMPDLAANATLDRTLEYAILSSGELEAAFLDWRAAIERIPQAGALPDPRVDFQLLLAPGIVGGLSQVAEALLGSVRLSVSQENPARGKRGAQAAQALAEAQAAAERFRGAKFRLQRQVTQSYARLALTRDLIANTSETLALLDQTRSIALLGYEHSVEAKTTTDIKKSELEIERAASDQRGLAIEEQSLRAELNGLLDRPPKSPFQKVRLPDPPASPIDAPALLTRAVERNAELAALRKEIDAKGSARVLAELQAKSDFTFGAGLEAPLTPVLMGGATLPINREKIRAGIAGAEAEQKAIEARLRHGESDVRSRLVIALSGIADATRILTDTEESLLPKAGETLEAQKAQYGAGAGSYADLLDTQRTLVELRRLALQARANRIARFADLEEILAADLLRPSAQPPVPAGKESRP